MRAVIFALMMGAMCAAAPLAADPFERLRAAYASRGAEAAAAVYAPDAMVTYPYDGSPVERHAGREAIASSFQALFKQIDAARPLDLNFRAIERRGDSVAGVYRLRFGREGASYGRFAVTLTPERLFASDLSTSATLADFEEAAGPVMLASDEEILDRRYYGRLTGRYVQPNGCDLVVTRSIARLFVRDTCTNEWRGLTRKTGLVWTTGDRVLSGAGITDYRFEAPRAGQSASVLVSDGAGTKAAIRRRVYRQRDMVFASTDGTRLAGTLYLPEGRRGRRPASVIIHGSGSQDRDGYASIIAVLADQLAASGRVVLTYDKRGSGGSSGDGARAGFDQLAADAEAGLSMLATLPQVDRDRIGLAGSSQAGWVVARVIARGARPADVLLLGAAGAAMTVAEQNLYNTEVRMGCAGIPDADIRLALDQQRAFFAHLADSRAAPALDALTARASRRPKLAEWLFPDSRTTDRSAGAWYVVLDPAFDPLPVWRRYPGKALFLFGEHDDSTPTKLAMRRLSGGRAEARIVHGAQHLGLLASDPCKGELTDTRAFAPAVMAAVAAFGAARARR